MRIVSENGRGRKRIREGQRRDERAEGERRGKVRRRSMREGEMKARRNGEIEKIPRGQRELRVMIAQRPVGRRKVFPQEMSRVRVHFERTRKKTKVRFISSNNIAAFYASHRTRRHTVSSFRMSNPPPTKLDLFRLTRVLACRLYGRLRVAEAIAIFSKISQSQRERERNSHEV